MARRHADGEDGRGKGGGDDFQVHSISFGDGRWTTPPSSNGDACALGGGALGALALVLLEEALAQADRLRGDLGELVVADEFHCVLEGERDRRREVDRLVLARGADVG